MITILRIRQQKTWGQRRVLFFFLSAVPINFGRWLKIYCIGVSFKASLNYCRICRLFVSTIICESYLGLSQTSALGLKSYLICYLGWLSPFSVEKQLLQKRCMMWFNFFFYWNITAIFGSKIWENIPSELNQRLIGASSWMNWITKDTSIIKVKHIYLFGRFIHRQTTLC